MSALTHHMGSSSAGDATEALATDDRDPAHELFAHAAALSAAAHGLEAAARSPGAVTAVAPTLACLEASIVALASAISRLRALALTRLTEPIIESENLRPRRADVALSFERLTGVLEQAEVACARARDAIDPVLVELTVT